MFAVTDNYLHNITNIYVYVIEVSKKWLWLLKHFWAKYFNYFLN